MSLDPTGSIGVFDSGIGGLTVFAAIRRELPNESLIYLGDTARVPYGTKSAETVIRYSKECASFLIDRGVKALVIACNTASSYALTELTNHFDVPVLGVIEPGAQRATKVSNSHIIGVIGTTGTISSNAYGAALKAINSKVRVVSKACPIFVPLVEEGWIDNDVALAAAHRYLDDMCLEGIDTLVLGCTHYPLLAGVVQKVVGSGVSLVDSAQTTAKALKQMLAKLGLESKGKSKAQSRIYVTDLPSRFESIAQNFLEEHLPAVARVDL